MSYANKLPDTYRKDPNSNNYKLLKITESAIQDIEKDIDDIDNSLDINKAYGETLDYYGDLYEQPRGALNDDKYRILLQSKIENLLVDGSYQSVLNSICRIFNCNPSDIEIKDKEDSILTVQINGLPISAIIKSGFSSEQAMQIIKRLLPVCVSISSDTVFEGTFEFASNEGETDNITGLANDELTIGGTLSLIVEDRNDIVLPI